MNLIRAFARNDVTAGVSLGERPEALSDLNDEDCAAAIWQRQALPAFQTWIDGLEPEQLPRARLIIRPVVAEEAIGQICDLCGTPDCEHRTRLVGDIAAMAEIFADLMGAPFIRVRLDVITTNACRKFHIDALTARLVCTYRGTGTQYGISKDGADPDPIFTVPTGAPILLRGTQWPEHPRSGLLHRSPPIEGTGEARLVLVLDPIAEQEDTADHQSLH